MAKPKNPALVERDRAIVEARRAGELSLGEFARMHGITRERARQIAKAGGVDPAKAVAAHAKIVAEREYEKAEKQSGAILMLFIAGKSYKEIAEATSCQITSVREVLDEQVTDEVLAARSTNMTARTFPEAKSGPREVRPERADRHWNAETVMAALVNFARERGGRLPSSTQYQQIAPTRDDLPSFATVRNRLGRWSDVRVDVHRAAR
jgi:hypothetical protein